MTVHTKKSSIPKKIINLLIPVLLIAAGGVAWAYFQSTAPQVERKPAVRQATIVDVLTAKMEDVKPVITAMGTVVPAREIVLRARASGEVRHLAPRFIPGGYIAKDELILQLDAEDYAVEIQKAESALAKARGNLALEEGNQTIAREEVQLLLEASGETLSVTDLAMRKPQLMQAQADIASAEADLLRARLNLSRTEIRAPFNCLVVARNVDLGSLVNPQDSLATLVSVDEYWVEAAVPMDRLSLLDLAREDGYPALVRSQAGGGQWQGQTLRTTGRLNEASRMATLMVRVGNPLGLGSQKSDPQMMLNDYVSVEITGKTISSVVGLSRDALRDNQTLWIHNKGRLEIRKVDIVWKQGGRVFVGKGLMPGEQVVVSNLSTAVDGMHISTSEKGNGSVHES
jgi:RND family efflux transporter MFP subunit